MMLSEEVEYESVVGQRRWSRGECEHVYADGFFGCESTGKYEFWSKEHRVRSLVKELTRNLLEATDNTCVG